MHLFVFTYEIKLLVETIVVFMYGLQKIEPFVVDLHWVVYKSDCRNE